MRTRLATLGAIALSLAAPALSGYDDSDTNAYPIKGGYAPNEAEVVPEGYAVNDIGVDGTSKACRYDEGPGWTDCDPFELIRYKVLHLVAGGSQCEDMKNITKHCTPHEFPHGTHWLIQEHRKCIAELGRLKAMIADLDKFIQVMHKKGKELYGAYQGLKKKMEELTIRLDKLKMEGEHQEEILENIKKEIDEWKLKARDLQVQVDEIKAKYHDLQEEETMMTNKNEQLINDINILEKENEGVEKKIEVLKRENEELKRKVLETEHVKNNIADAKAEKMMLEGQQMRLDDQIEALRDQLTECKIAKIGKHNYLDEEGGENKDTHVDLSMEMLITHNRTDNQKMKPNPVYYQEEYYPKRKKDNSNILVFLVSLISYTISILKIKHIAYTIIELSSLQLRAITQMSYILLWCYK